jgi:hypothetical protein
MAELQAGGTSLATETGTDESDPVAAEDAVHADCALSSNSPLAPLNVAARSR